MNFLLQAGSLSAWRVFFAHGLRTRRMAADREGPGLSSSPEIMRDFSASTSCQCLAIFMYRWALG